MYSFTVQFSFYFANSTTRGKEEKQVSYSYSTFVHVAFCPDSLEFFFVRKELVRL